MENTTRDESDSGSDDDRSHMSSGVESKASIELETVSENAVYCCDHDVPEI